MKGIAFRIRLHSDVFAYLEERSCIDGVSIAKTILNLAEQWNLKVSQENETPIERARLVWAAYIAPRGQSKLYSFRSTRVVELAASAAAADPIIGGWQSALNSIIRTQLHQECSGSILEHQPNGLERIVCIAGNREFLLSGNADGEFGGADGWERAGGSRDEKGRFVIRDVKFDSNKFSLFSGTTWNERTPEWHEQLVAVVTKLTGHQDPEEIPHQPLWGMFCAQYWVNFEMDACAIWARQQITTGALRFEDAPKLLDRFDDYVLWRATEIRSGRNKGTRKSPKPINVRRRSIEQRTIMIATNSPEISNIKPSKEQLQFRMVSQVTALRRTVSPNGLESTERPGSQKVSTGRDTMRPTVQ